MTAEEMKAKCEAIARETFPPGSAHSYASENAALYRAQERVGKRIADAIAALPVEPDPLDAQIAILRAALEPFARLSSRVREALAATEPKT